MQVTKFLCMNKAQLQEKIEKTEAKIENLGGQVNLLEGLQKSAKGHSTEPKNLQNRG